MKSYLNTLLLFCLCIAVGQAQAIKGSGHVTRKEVPTGNFTKLRNTSSANVYLTDASKTSAIVIEADDNLIPYLEINTEDGVLTIRHKNNSWFNTKNNINVYVPVKTLSELENNGSGNLTAQKTIESPAFTFTSSGSGNTTLPLKTQELQLQQTGSGNVSLSGQTQSLSITLRGSGNLTAEKLAAEVAQAKLSGSGNAQIKCSTELTVQLSGSGNLMYAGSPRLVKKVTGSGEVGQINR